MTREGQSRVSSRRFLVGVSMGSLQRHLLFAILLGLSYGSSEEDYSSEEWKTRYAPLKCEKQPHVGIRWPGKFLRWFYNTTSSRCESFHSRVNNSKGNNFPSREACNKYCRDEHYGMCADPKNSSVCSNTWEQRFWFNPDNKTCEPYLYRGCDGNTNSFRSRLQCIEQCSEFIDDICRLPIDRGDCLSTDIRYGYNPACKACESFNYTGCGGNRNNFRSAHKCWTTCAKNSRCLKHTQENSEWYRLRKSYYYNSTLNECRLTKTFLEKVWGLNTTDFPPSPSASGFVCENTYLEEPIPSNEYGSGSSFTEYAFTYFKWGC
uniref:BPTI/Kunitz inhibitor domain-containing protein n=1 Tax=Amblyomma maculatum TaxID=34609 RepID=G3MRG5_AMBMU